MDLGVYQYANGSNDAGLAAFERAVELAPSSSAERAQALAAFGTGLQMAWRHLESLAVCEQALALARATGARAAELRALTVLGSDLAYLGRAIGFELDDAVYGLTRANLSVLGLDIDLRHDGYDRGIRTLGEPDEDLGDRLRRARRSRRTTAMSHRGAPDHDDVTSPWSPCPS